MHFRLALLLAGLSLAPALLLSTPALAQVGIGVSINIAPPELPVYEQPPVPGAGFLWSPGYWAWGGQDYYWVPGTWVQAPEPGLLWTPGYWGWGEGAYLWHEGYWGPHVGFYGGVDYGFGYGGRGYEGGEWRGGAFFYNRSVNNVPESVHITNVYNRTVINNVTVNRVSFNGGSGGIAARPTAQETSYAQERHVPPVSAQVHNAEAARAEPALHSNANHGAPAIAATAHPGTFTGAGVVHARGAAPAGARPAAQHTVAPTHPVAPARTVAPAHTVAPPTHTVEAAHSAELRPTTPATHPVAAPPPHEPAHEPAHQPAHEPAPRGNEHDHEQH